MRPLAPAARLAQKQLLGRAVALLQRQQTAQAEAVLGAVLERWPGQADAEHFLGVLRHLQGRHTAALTLIRRAIDALPGEPGPWNNLGNVLMALQQHDEAEAAYRRCLSLQPGFTEAIGNLAALCSRRGALPEAAHWYRQALARDPDNPLYQHHLAACLDEAPPARASDAYLQQVFDKAAAEFDARLGGLGYQAPECAVQVLSSHLAGPSRQFDIGDLGCGTGLCGPLLRPWARRLVGCDLSTGMLERARERRVYDDLQQVELLAFLQARAASFDLLVCTDTLIYIGELSATLEAVAHALRPGGWFVCSIEALAETDAQPLRLLPHGRYVHQKAYVSETLRGAALQIVDQRPFTLREEAGVAVPGWMMLARRPTTG